MDFATSLIAGRQNRLAELAQADDRRFRRDQAAQQQANADRTFDLQTRQFEANNARADQQLAISQEQLAISQEQLAMARAEGARAAERLAAEMDAQELAAERENTKRALAAAYAGPPEKWDETVTALGEPELVGQYENREMWVAFHSGLEDTLDRMAPPAPLTDAGKMAVDQRNGFIPEGPAPVDLEDVDKFRKEFSGLPNVKAFSEQSQAYGRIVASAQDPSPAGDLALIFNYMKVLDPGSVVRESEFETAAQASAWLQEQEQLGVAVPRPVAAAIRGAVTGERLSDRQRADFVNRGERLYQDAERQFANTERQYQAIARSRNYPEDQALIDFRYQPPEIPPGPPGQPNGAPDPSLPGSSPDAPALSAPALEALQLYGGGSAR